MTNCRTISTLLLLLISCFGGCAFTVANDDKANLHLRSIPDEKLAAYFTAHGLTEKPNNIYQDGPNIIAQYGGWNPIAVWSANAPQQVAVFPEAPDDRTYHLSQSGKIQLWKDWPGDSSFHFSTAARDRFYMTLDERDQIFCAMEQEHASTTFKVMSLAAPEKVLASKRVDDGNVGLGGIMARGNRLFIFWWKGSGIKGSGISRGYKCSIYTRVGDQYQLTEEKNLPGYFWSADWRSSWVLLTDAWVAPSRDYYLFNVETGETRPLGFLTGTLLFLNDEEYKRLTN